MKQITISKIAKELRINEIHELIHQALNMIDKKEKLYKEYKQSILDCTTEDLVKFFLENGFIFMRRTGKCK